jgi:hypothetical protein
MNRQLGAMQDRTRRGVEKYAQARGGLRFGRIVGILSDRILRHQRQRNQPNSEFCHVQLTVLQEGYALEVAFYEGRAGQDRAT